MAFNLACCSISQATILDPTNSTGKGETRMIDLTNNVTNINQPNVIIATQPDNGSAQAITCPRTGENLCVSYTPDFNFVGIDSFNVSTTNDNNETETGTVTVNKAGAVSKNSGTIPNDAIQGTLNNICGSSQSVDVEIRCQDFNTANATAGELTEDLRELIDALTPQDIAAQSTTSNTLAAQQLENIGTHLAALRSGQKNVSINGLSFN